MSGPYHDTSVGYASSHKIEAFISYMRTVLATLLLVGAILVLYKVNSNDLKLGLIALFTIIFAGSVGLLTNSSMAEVFGATAASVSFPKASTVRHVETVTLKITL